MKTVRKVAKLMNSDGIIYTDGRDVTVTPFQFIIGKHEYLLEGITKIRFLTMKPNRATGILLVVLGIVLVIVGAMQLITPILVNVNMNQISTMNAVALYGGIVIALIGIILLIRMHDRYAVRITTAEGDKDAIVSENRDYVQQIISALQEAMMGYQNKGDIVI